MQSQATTKKEPSRKNSQVADQTKELMAKVSNLTKEVFCGLLLNKI